jgi:glucosyl-3-phosphoglycerate synthase
MNKKPRYKLILFDMDGTLLAGKTIHLFAESLGFNDQLNQILESNIKSYKKIIQIAGFFKGCHRNELLSMFREIPLQNHVLDIATYLRKQNIITAIATASYQFLADDLQQRLQFNYAFGNNLLFDHDVATGELVIHNHKLYNHNGKIYSICKSKILEDLCTQHHLRLTETIAIGDGSNDIDMIKEAGLGIAFNAPVEVQEHADLIITDFKEMLKYLEG